jgi:hypothetical protein
MYYQRTIQSDLTKPKGFPVRLTQRSQTRPLADGELRHPSCNRHTMTIRRRWAHSQLVDGYASKTRHVGLAWPAVKSSRMLYNPWL